MTRRKPPEPTWAHWTCKDKPRGARVGERWFDGTTTRTLTVFEGREVWVDYYGEVME